MSVSRRAFWYPKAAPRMAATLAATRLDNYGQ
jgi:hypothetical protein